MRKILIIRLSSIGDIVLTTPVIRCLKKQMPDAEIHFLTKAAFKSILQHNPYINKLHLLENDLSEVINRLKKESYDLVVDLHYNLRTARLKAALGTKNVSFNKLNIEKFLRTRFKINRLPKLHIVDRNLETIKFLGVYNDGAGLDYFISPEDLVDLSSLPPNFRNGYIGMVIGAALETKKLPIEKIAALCNGLTAPILLLGGPEDAKNGEIIARINPGLIYNACGKFSLNQSASLVQQAKIVISHDTGLMHIAAAFRKPIISIWGNTVPEFGMGPYYGQFNVQNIISEVTNLRCRPCSKIGYDKCPKKHFHCMNLQPIERIAAAANELYLNA